MSLPMPGFSHFTNQPFVRVSALLDFCRCPRRYFYRYGCGLTSREPRTALVFGEAIHASLGWLLLHQGDIGGAMSRFGNVWKDEHEAFSVQVGDQKRNRYNALRMLNAWLSNHQPGQSIYEPVPPPKHLVENVTVITPMDHQSDMELPFVLDLGLPLLLAGRIDGLAKHRSTGELWTLEFKTTSDATTRFYDGFEFNPQMLSYAIACRGWNLPVKGCFIEGLEVKAPLKTKESTPKVQIQPVLFQEHLLEDHLQFLRRKVSELYSMIEQQDFPKFFTGCNCYSTFGQPGYNCDYRLLCNVPDWQQNMSIFEKTGDHLFKINQPAQITTKELL